LTQIRQSIRQYRKLRYIREYSHYMNGKRRIKAYIWRLVGDDVSRKVDTSRRICLIFWRKYVRCFIVGTNRLTTRRHTYFDTFLTQAFYFFTLHAQQVQVPVRCTVSEQCARCGAVGVFLAPQCAASRCPWMSTHLVPVVRVPSCSRGPPCVVVYCTCTTNLYYSTVGTKKGRTLTNEPRTKFHLIERIATTGGVRQCLPHKNI